MPTLKSAARAALLLATLGGIGYIGVVKSRPQPPVETANFAKDGQYNKEDILGWADGEPVLRAGTFSVISIYDPKHVKPNAPNLGKTAGTTMADDEPVLGVEVNGDVRAYSTWYMNAREIINDEVGGVPLLITW